MDVHAPELLRAALWFIGLLITGTAAVVWWFLRQGLDQITSRLDRHDGTMREIRDLLSSEIGQLRELQHDMDKRLIKIETTCWAQHGKPVI